MRQAHPKIGQSQILPFRHGGIGADCGLEEVADNTAAAMASGLKEVMHVAVASGALLLRPDAHASAGSSGGPRIHTGGDGWLAGVNRRADERTGRLERGASGAGVLFP